MMVMRSARRNRYGRLRRRTKGGWRTRSLAARPGRHRARGRIFLRRSTQHVASGSTATDWLAAGGMLAAAASWGLLASLLVF
jgi:hypothetical protein